MFVTWRLYGSLPASFLRRLKDNSRAGAGRKFREADAGLDYAQRGRLWLQDARVADSLVTTIQRGAHALGHYRLYAFVVMANRTHLLIDPIAPLSQVTNGVKGASTRDANRILGRVGKRFWQDETFDH